MNKTVLSLIDQLIERTKTKELSWKPYSNFKSALKPLYSSSLKLSPILSASQSINKPVLIPEESYVCVYNNGYFYLLLYRSMISGTEITLRVQTNSSKNSKIYASTSSVSEDNLQISSQLKRLYNLVESTPVFTEIDDFINDFISNEENH